MALTVSSPHVFNENVGKQAYASGNAESEGSKCFCCPYGYHIDLDFVQYCEAVAAGNTDRNTIERRRKRVKRRQCQSMEILLGLVSPTATDEEYDLLQLSKNEPTVDINGITTLPRTGHVNTPIAGNSHQHSAALDLSDVVGDFEATLKRLTKPTKSHNQNNQSVTDETIPMCPTQNATHVDISTDCDSASVGSGNSNLSTSTLQNIRDQMASSLKRMKELEEQVKSIPTLNIQISVLRSEKRMLQKQIIQLKSGNIVTREIGTMCKVTTRDIGISSPQVRTQDIGMVTSTPIQSNKQAECVTFDINEAKNASMKNHMLTPKYKRCSSDFFKNASSSLPRLSLSNKTTTDSPLEFQKKNSLNKTQIKTENIDSQTIEFKDISTNTEEIQPKKLTISRCNSEEIISKLPINYPIRETRSCETETALKMQNILTPEDTSLLIKNSIIAYQESIEKNKKVSTKSTQCTPEIPKVPVKKNQETQMTMPYKINVGITAKPRTTETGSSVKPGPGTKSIAVGPDPESTQTVSLNLLNSRSHSFNYGDTTPKKRRTKSVGSTVDDLIKTSTKYTDTNGLAPKLRDFGTSPIKKKFVDISVGESLKPHIEISCTANYCDNCKEKIKTLAKQIPNNSENIYSHSENQNSYVSKIPRLSHNPSNSAISRQNLIRQDTYTKFETGIIRYDADNKDSYNTDNKDQLLVTNDENKDDKKEPKKISVPDKETDTDEKASLSESALFEPIRDKSRKKLKPSLEMRSAMKIMNDILKKPPSKSTSLQKKNATSIIQKEWFKISSHKLANPFDVEDYLDCFEEYSSHLLEFIVNMTDDNGNTAMHYAVSNGNFDIVSILLDSKVCDVNKANAIGYTIIMLAALAEIKNATDLSVINRLFQLADVNIKAKLFGQTALMLAVSKGRKDTIRLLLDAGAAVNIQDDDGSTALMCAVEHGYIDIVKILLAHPDCNWRMVDNDGSSALKIALAAGESEIGVLLYAHQHLERNLGSGSFIKFRKTSKSSTVSSPSAPVNLSPSRQLNTPISSSSVSNSPSRQLNTPISSSSVYNSPCKQLNTTKLSPPASKHSEK